VGREHAGACLDGLLEQSRSCGEGVEGPPIIYNTKAALDRSTQLLLAIIGQIMMASGLLHPHGVLIHHQVRIGRPIKHDVHS
jgi:hypothetical protein